MRIALLLTATLWASAGSAGQPDVIGIQIGTTQQNLVAILKAHNPKLKLTPTREYLFESLPSMPMTFGLHAMYFEANAQQTENITIAMSGGPAPSRMLMIRREVSMSRQPTTLTVLLDSMRKKYGPEADKNPSHHEYIWLFDNQGAPVPKGNGRSFSTCAHLRMPSLDFNPGLGLSGWKPEKRDCGTVVRLNVVLGQGELVNNFNVSMSNAMYEEASRKQLFSYLEKAEAAKVGKQESAASKNAPKL